MKFETEAERHARHDWANAWTAEIAAAAGGLRVEQWWSIRQLLHDLRRQIEAGDVGKPKPSRLTAEQLSMIEAMT